MRIHAFSGLGLGGGNVEIFLLDAKATRRVENFLQKTAEERCPPLIPTELFQGGILGLRMVKNRMVKSGREKFRDLMGFPTTAEPPAPGATNPFGMQYMAVGTGATAVLDSQTALVTEVFRKELTRRIAGEASGDPELNVQLFILDTEANGNTLVEAGLFSEPAGGKLWARTVFTPIGKTSASSLTINWRLPLKAV